MISKRMVGPAVVAAALMAGPQAFAADAAADVYKGKTVFLQIGAGTGNIYDFVGRIFAKHMGKHIPGNPTVVAQNVPGGGSLPLANQFGNTTARDGTVFGVFNNGMPTTPLFDPASGRYDPRKFHFLGSPSREAHILSVWHTAPVKTVGDLFTKELIVGATSPGAAPYDFPRLTNAVIGTKFKIVTGYQTSGETKLAMARGEVHANAGVAWSQAKTDYADVIKSGELITLAAFGMHKNRELMDVPLLPVGDTVEQKQLFELMYGRQSYGRPFATPPEVPAYLVAALRQAFEATMKDAEFLAEAQRLNLEIDPVSADELTALTDNLYKTPNDILERMRATLSAGAK